MAEEFALAFAQAARWVIAGVAGAAFAKNDLLDKSFWYQFVFIGLFIAAATAVEYLIQILIVP